MLIQFKNYSKKYADSVVLNIASLELPKGIYWLKGINGSGKSTLLKSLSGIIPFDGLIAISEVDVKREKRKHRKMVNYAEAEPVYPDFLTGLDIVRLYAETKGDSTSFTSLVEAFELTDAVGHQTGTYSSGMLKKLSLICAFLGSPELILLDEPLITLDTQAVNTMLHLIQQYFQKGISFIITSHQDVDFPSHKLPLNIIKIENKTVVPA
jgi:ABC-2 type transport system ATP-binding protein